VNRKEGESNKGFTGVTVCRRLASTILHFLVASGRMGKNGGSVVLYMCEEES
jgi:hypothetical protein